MKLNLPTIEDMRLAYREGEEAVVMPMLMQVSLIAAVICNQQSL